MLMKALLAFIVKVIKSIKKTLLTNSIILICFTWFQIIQPLTK